MYVHVRRFKWVFSLYQHTCISVHPIDGINYQYSSGSIQHHCDDHMFTTCTGPVKHQWTKWLNACITNYENTSERTCTILRCSIISIFITVTSQWPRLRLKSPQCTRQYNRVFKPTLKKTSKPAWLWDSVAWFKWCFNDNNSVFSVAIQEFLLKWRW